MMEENKPNPKRSFRMCPVASVQPYALMMAPVFVHMKLNDKFVMLKRSLDFFTEEELEKVRRFETFYMPEEVETSVRYRFAASEVRSLLDWGPARSASHGGRVRKELKDYVTPATFEISDAILRMIAPLWKSSKGGVAKIDPFFVSVFVNELCDPIDPKTLKQCRDHSIFNFEKAVISSSWAVFLALHLGLSNIPFLNRLRTRVFLEVAISIQAKKPMSPDIEELLRAARESLGEDFSLSPQAEGGGISAEALVNGYGKTSEKLTTRFRRIEGMIGV